MISKFFIERHSCKCLAVITIIIGVISYLRLPVEQYPPIIRRQSSHDQISGASASVVAQTIWKIPIGAGSQRGRKSILHVFHEQQ